MVIVMIIVGFVNLAMMVIVAAAFYFFGYIGVVDFDEVYLTL